MTLYADSSALIKRYVGEDDSDTAESVLLGDPEWVTGRHTFVEVMLAIHRRLGDAERTAASVAFERDWERTLVVALDDLVCRRAAELGIVAGARSLDALHLAAAERAGGRSLPIVTFDIRLAHAARSLGFGVIGA
ncbi:MAG: type II toxin-antitoxin system VapC family toxin [Chloroflexota bacterium]|nr:type II toxin-antitoxin system VapC family toxin [Chloroflexota bacterium]